MKTAKSLIVGGVAFACALLAVADGASQHVKMAQRITLVAGWNAVYAMVSPDESADEIFGSWPVDSVAVYDPAAFLATKQYSGAESTEGTSRIGYSMWRRGETALSPVKAVVANSVYVCYATNVWNGVLYGSPSAPRVTWHPSSTNDVMNLVGIAIDAEERTTLGGYFEGLDVGNVNFLKFYTLGGGDPMKISLGPASGITEFQMGGVAVVTATKASDWSGVLNVSPIDGFDFSTNIPNQVLSVRNDGTNERTVSIAIVPDANPSVGAALPAPTGLMARDTSVYTNGWFDFSTGVPFTRTLAAGEKLDLRLAVDRTRLLGPAGTRYGGLLKIRDVDGGSRNCVTVPLEVTSDGGAGGEFAWPKGLWLASATFDKVTVLKADSAQTHDAKSGGTVPVRLPLYVESDGTMTLLQRVIVGTDTNGTGHVYSPRVEEAFPVAIGNVKRISSAVLPIDNPVLVVTNDVFGSQATFAFTVGEGSRVNPLKHAYHPSHDGLQWDFDTRTPSGDDLENYISAVKPELFSITNRIIFTWNPSAGSAWNPEETLDGSIVWELGGLRHEGPIRMKGDFTMKRISSLTLDR